MKKLFKLWFIKKNLFAGGSGSRQHPYLIENAVQLAAVRNYLEAHFCLVADIDLGGTKWIPIGSHKERFTGTFKGNGHRIYNLKLKASGTDYAGLFGCIGKGGVITLLGLVNCSIQGKNFAGGVTGANIGTISQCFVEGKISGRSHVGGLNGWNVESGEIQACYSLAAVHGKESVGGLVGANFDSIVDCYAAGKVQGDKQYIGGVVGLDYLNYQGAVKDSYFDRDVTGQADTGKGIPKTTEEMKQRNTYENWDFEKTWDIEEGKTYPYLKVFIKKQAKNVSP